MQNKLRQSHDGLGTLQNNENREIQEMQQQQAMQQMPQGGPPGVNQAPGRTGAAPGGGEGAGAAPTPPMPMQNMSMEKDATKFDGRTGGITPDYTMKVAGEEDDVDAIAAERAKEFGTKGWMKDLFE